MKLTKRNVEALLDSYDDDPIGALTAALGRVLDQPQSSWKELVAAGPFTAGRRERLQRGDQDALDQMLSELNETRTVTSEGN